MNRLPFFKGLVISLGLSMFIWGGVIYIITNSFSADDTINLPIVKEDNSAGTVSIEEAEKNNNSLAVYAKNK